MRWNRSALWSCPGLAKRTGKLAREPWGTSCFLSDDDCAQIMAACQPLAPQCRAAFLQAVVAELAGCPVIGPGRVYRAVAAAQQRFFDPPDLSDAVGPAPLKG